MKLGSHSMVVSQQLLWMSVGEEARQAGAPVVYLIPGLCLFFHVLPRVI